MGSGQGPSFKGLNPRRAQATYPVSPWEAIVPTQKDAQADVTPLERRLVEQIRAEGPLRFDAFMQAALYDLEHGFYSGTEAGVRTGEAGDFVTAPMLTPVFASALARFCVRAWQKMGEPRDWLLVEPGGGTGELLAGIVRALEGLDEEARRGVRAVLVDASPAHREQAKRNLSQVLRGSRVEVTDALPAVDAPAVVLANELLDNLPVRLLVRREGAWWERVVDASEQGGLAFSTVPADEGLVEWVEGFGVPVPEDHQVEVPVGVGSWFGQVTGAVGKHPVVMVLVDYGEVARDLLGEPRPWGTMQAYEAQRSDRDVLVRPGKRDVTVHVNWSAVGRIAQEAGWGVVAFADQFSFLSGLGAVEEAVRLAQEEASVEAMERLSALKEVLLPGGMGESVKVLVLSRGLRGAKDASWAGLDRVRELEPAPRQG